MNYVRESLNKYSIEFVNIGSTLIQDFSLLRLCGNSRLREQLAPNRIIFHIVSITVSPHSNWSLYNKLVQSRCSAHRPRGFPPLHS